MISYSSTAWTWDGRQLLQLYDSRDDSCVAWACGSDSCRQLIHEDTSYTRVYDKVLRLTGGTLKRCVNDQAV